MVKAKVPKTTQASKPLKFKEPEPFDEDLGFEWSDEWVLPEKTATHIQEDWLWLVEEVLTEIVDRGMEMPSDEEVVELLIPRLFEEPLPTWEDYYTKALTIILE